ncbi:cdc42 effector protein 2-like [Sinocyclocheilus rhinocerous]|uniref:Cdc42 effector protein 2-like n=1 Tax=Sinocyclocheilus rhinocerous TaxID=307959 RepID=A0A673L0T6_9TELE|nr:PREDICTED: cdc42 effector protein 2-like [Sinocyclocheilus rhinocerous]XP_016380776.1 PREDICTED: cdc42 effector protein 2-like [Sinocyclocheilus rhinocerous]
MPAKTPMYLKTSTPKRGKKQKIRDILSGDMISPPLGDVRHSAHVGPEGEGDMFGDVGFLQGKLDMLPALNQAPSSRSHSIDRRMDEILDVNSKSHTYHRSHNSHHNSLLKTTISMPVFIAPVQPPPKPPRLHLDEQPSPVHQQQNHHHSPTQKRSMSVCEEGIGKHRDPCRDLTLSASIPVLPHLVPSTGSLSEASSDDSMSEGCGPLDPKRGLSLDSDAGLSNEDLRSEHCESPAISPSMSRSESLMGLDLDLGPSILEDVLRIMDRYKSVEERHEI